MPTGVAVQQAFGCLIFRCSSRVAPPAEPPSWKGGAGLTTPMLFACQLQDFCCAPVQRRRDRSGEP